MAFLSYRMNVTEINSGVRQVAGRYRNPRHGCANRSGRRAQRPVGVCVVVFRQEGMIGKRRSGRFGSGIVSQIIEYVGLLSVTILAKRLSERLEFRHGGFP